MLTQMNTTPTMQLAEARMGRPLREALLGEMSTLSVGEICDQLGVSPSTLERWMRRLGLERRSVIVEAHDIDGTTNDSIWGENHDDPDPRALASVRGAGVAAHGG